MHGHFHFLITIPSVACRCSDNCQKLSSFINDSSSPNIQFRSDRFNMIIINRYLCRKIELMVTDLENGSKKQEIQNKHTSKTKG